MNSGKRTPSPRSLQNLRPFKRGGDPRRSTNGRPKELPELKAACREQADKCLQVYVDALSDADPRIRLMAAERLLERGFGKPVIGDTDPANGQVTTLQWIEVQRALAAS